MLTRGGGGDGLLGVQAARSGKDHDICVALRQKFIKAPVAWRSAYFLGGLQSRWLDVAHADKLRVGGVLPDRFEVVLGNAAAACEREANAASDDGLVLSHLYAFTTFGACWR